MASPPASSASPAAEASTSRPSAGRKLTCLCAPTNHPGSFRCSRHRSPRGRPSSSGRASAAAPSGGEGIRSGNSGRAKGRSVLRAHLLRMISPPSGHYHRRCRDFQPHPSRLGLVST